MMLPHYQELQTNPVAVLRIVCFHSGFHHYNQVRFHTLRFHIHIRNLHRSKHLLPSISPRNLCHFSMQISGPHQFNYKSPLVRPSLIAALISTFVHCTTYLRTEILANEVVVL